MMVNIKGLLVRNGLKYMRIFRKIKAGHKCDEKRLAGVIIGKLRGQAEPRKIIELLKG